MPLESGAERHSDDRCSEERFAVALPPPRLPPRPPGRPDPRPPGAARALSPCPTGVRMYALLLPLVADSGNFKTVSASAFGPAASRSSSFPTLRSIASWQEGVQHTLLLYVTGKPREHHARVFSDL